MLTWAESLVGGLYAGTATTSVWYLNSMVAGHSNMFGHVFRGDVENKNLFSRRVFFMLGLFCAGIVMLYALPLRDISMEAILKIPWFHYLIAGLMIGFGTQIAGGCTLGGVPFGSMRSIMSFIVFFVVAFAVNNWAHGGWRYLWDGGKTSITEPVTMTGVDAGMTLGIYAGLLALLALSSLVKRRLNSFVGSMLIMFIAAVMFGIGFGLGGMLQQSKALGSMDMSVRWDPSVWIFSATSLLVTIVGVQIVRGAGFFSSDEPPESVAVTDFWLVIGAAMVGVSFGLCGLTLGSAVTLIPTMFKNADSAMRLGIFLCSAIVGVWAHFGLSKAAVRGKA
eukprot:GDKJ01012373.1.p1 GENE.GDKJ01012373.1~~GDKJ01012373.1.p1  ORF type:complete len:336 (+),score=42.65 GDKJ01012373.1:171-1178(+)